MSPLHFVIMLIVAIIILTVLTLKFKMHPVMVLFIPPPSAVWPPARPL